MFTLCNFIFLSMMNLNKCSTTMLLSLLHAIPMLNFMKFGGHLLFYLILQSLMLGSLKLENLENVL